TSGSPSGRRRSARRSAVDTHLWRVVSTSVWTLARQTYRPRAGSRAQPITHDTASSGMRAATETPNGSRRRVSNWTVGPLRALLRAGIWLTAKGMAPDGGIALSSSVIGNDATGS